MAVPPMTSIALTALLLSVAVVVTRAASAGSHNNDGSGKANSLVVEACKNMSSDLLKKTIHFDEEPCVSVLHSDNQSMVAKDHGDLVVIALSVLDNRTNEIATKIDDILCSLSVHKQTQLAFQFCSANYAAMVRTVPICRDLFLEVKPLGKKTPCGKAIVALTCLDRLGPTARECSLMLCNDWDDDKTEEFYDIARHLNLAWGLMEMATDCRDNDADW